MKKVLVVDDAPTVRKLVTFTLEDEGFEMFEACDGSEALRVIGDNEIDIGIFDVNMPGIDGIQLTREALASSGGKDMKIIILTTESSDALKVAGKEAGAIGWLVKPFEDEALVSMVTQI